MQTLIAITLCFICKPLRAFDIFIICSVSDNIVADQSSALLIYKILTIFIKYFENMLCYILIHLHCFVELLIFL